MEEHDRASAKLSSLYEQVKDAQRQLDLVTQGLGATLKDTREWENRISRAEAVEAENVRLRQQIEALRSEFSSADQETDKRQQRILEDHERRAPETVIRVCEHGQRPPDSVSYATYTELARYCRDLYQEKQTLIKSYFDIMKSLKRCRAKCLGWNRLFEQETIEVQVKGEKVVFRRVGGDDSPAEEAEAEDQGEVDLPAVPEIRRSKEPIPPPPTTPTLQRMGDDDDDPSSTQSQDPRWPLEQSPQLPSSSSGPPTIVASRSVRKRGQKHQDSPVKFRDPALYGTGSFSRPVMVKSESSSSGLNLRAPEYDPSHELPGAEDVPADYLDPNSHPPLSEFSIYKSESLSTEPSGTPEEAEQRGAHSRPGKKRRALGQLDGNAIAANGQGTKRRKRDRGAAAVPLVAEDGENEDHTPKQMRSTGTSRATSGESPKSRLTKLLGEPIGPKPILSPSPGYRSDNPRTPIRQNQPRGDGTATKRTAASSKTAPVRPRHTSDGPEPEEEPLRAFPVSRLGLEHFKINPDRNQGLDFAFQDVVRNKAQRKCLSGCLRADCCGPIFRAMAVQECLGRPPIAQSVSYDSLHEKDREALKEYLPSLNLRLLSSKELRNHLVDVRARELANLFGKHRHAHDRPPTPPGFWRTDMPSTQELERDRQMAKEMERVKVLERYREAMRPGGLWMFADE